MTKSFAHTPQLWMSTDNNIPNIIPHVGLEVECTQTLPLPWEVERLFPIDPRLKCSNFRIKEEEDSDKNITTNRRSSAKPTEKNMNSH